MKTLIVAILALLFLNSCKLTGEQIVIVGDSWASFTCNYKSLDKALQNAGVQNVATNSTCPLTSELGAKAKNWLGDDFHKAAQLAITDRSVKVIYLSLGGNDFLATWNKNDSPAQEQAVFDTITGDLKSILAVYQAARPDVKILISAYDFPRFPAGANPIQHYADLYNGMGQPTPAELNNAILRFSLAVSKLADQKQVFYIQHYGLMQYYFGNSDFGLAPKTTLAPPLISPASNSNQSGGNPNFQTDIQAMLTVAGVVDSFHLSEEGFGMMADHTVNQYLKEWLQ